MAKECMLLSVLFAIGALLASYVVVMFPEILQKEPYMDKKHWL